MMLNSGTRPPSGVKLSCMLFTAPQLASVVTVANSAELAMPKRVFLALHVAAGLGGGGGGLKPELRQDRIAGLLERDNRRTRRSGT